METCQECRLRCHATKTRCAKQPPEPQSAAECSDRAQGLTGLASQCPPSGPVVHFGFYKLSSVICRERSQQAKGQNWTTPATGKGANKCTGASDWLGAACGHGVRHISDMRPLQPRSPTRRSHHHTRATSHHPRSC